MSSKALDFTISLIDKFSKPMKTVSASVFKFEKLTARTEKSFKKIGVGGVALWGTVKAFNALTLPAQEMQKALDLAGLSGVKSLDALRKESKEFSTQYATSAVDFVKSSMLIKNSISGISDNALPKITTKVNLLAKATGTSVEESAGYLSQMFNDYKSTADRMGKLNFTNQVTGLAAYAKQNFDLSPQQLKGMLEGSKSLGANYGVDISEQFAVMGTINQTMGSGGAGAYENFLKNIQNAGQQLGMTFVDTNGKLLSMPDILDKIQTKFNGNIIGNVKAQKELDKAFGDGARVVNALVKNSSVLDKHMTALGKNNGLELMQKMAEANVKPWDRISAKMENIQESIGRALLPAFNPVFDVLDKTIGQLATWLEMFPNIAKWIGIIAVAFLGLAAAAAVLSIISGVLSLLLSPITLIIIGIVAVGAAVYLLWSKWDEVTSWMIGKWNSLLDLLDNIVIFKPFVFMLRNIGVIFDGICIGIQWGWNAVTDLIANIFVFKALIAVFDLISVGFDMAISGIKGYWQDFIDLITNNPITRVFTGFLGTISGAFKATFRFLKSLYIDQINWFIDKLNYIPGFNIDLIENDPLSSAGDILTGANIDSIEPGGLSQEINNNRSQSVDNSRNVGTVNINVEGGLSPEQLYELEIMKSG